MFLARNIGGIALAAFMLMLAACNGTQDKAPDPKEQTQAQPHEKHQLDQSEPSDWQPPTVLVAAASIMNGLKDGDMSKLAEWAHPKKGVRFSPYGNVDTKADLVFTKNQLPGLMQDSTERTWRTFPGTGELIKMRYADYHKRFVYDAAFIKDAEIAVNEALGQGLTATNANQVYPKENYDFVEYHIKGDAVGEGKNWRNLRLVFEKIGDEHALVGIIHDQWTP